MERKILKLLVVPQRPARLSEVEECTGVACRELKFEPHSSKGRKYKNNNAGLVYACKGFLGPGRHMAQ